MAPFLRTAPTFMSNAHLVGAKNCDDALGRVLSDDPALVVLFRWVRRRPCMTRFENRLSEAGYQRRTLVMEFPVAPGLADRRFPEHRALRWQVYRRPPRT